MILYFGWRRCFSTFKRPKKIVWPLQQSTNAVNNTIAKPSTTRDPEDGHFISTQSSTIIRSKIFPISAICTTDSYNFEKLIPALKAKFPHITPWVSPHEDLVHNYMSEATTQNASSIEMDSSSTVSITKQPNLIESLPYTELVIFRHGVVVGWNITESLLYEQHIHGWLQEYEHKKGREDFLSSIRETETMPGEFVLRLLRDSPTHSGTPPSSTNAECSSLQTEHALNGPSSAIIRPTFSYVSDDKIVLGLRCLAAVVVDSSWISSMYSSSTDLFMERIVFSHGLARSVKLSFLEQLLEKFLERLRDIPSLLAKGGSIPYDRPTVMKHLGHLLYIRSQLNLHSELVETLPDLFWDEANRFENIYYHMGRSLAVTKRIELLNAKLDYVNELTSLLRMTLTERHGHNLEIMIIILIMIEIGFEIAHTIFPASK